MTAMPQVPPGVQCANACPAPCSGTSCFFLSYILSLLPLKLTVPNHDASSHYPLSMEVSDCCGIPPLLH